MKGTPLIFEVKGNSLDDGPGIRSVVFFKGCPLDCVWCHNPEGKRKEVEISYDKNICIGCNSCIGVCDVNAISGDNPSYIDRQKCTLCFKCVEVCPAQALTRMGDEMTIDEISAFVEKDIPFFKTSGGGVTLSGGEATLYMDFCSKVAKKLKMKNIPILLETCGVFNYEQFIKKIYPYLDLIYYDIKFINTGEHKKYCGLSNNTILSNFKKLNNLSFNKGISILPRVPLIPDITATDKNLSEISSFLKSEGVKGISLLPNNPLWGDKLDKLGGDQKSLHGGQMQEWLGNEQVEHFKSIFNDFEII